MSGLVMLNQQLVQIGRLMAGIMHEIRGPLSVIRGSAELLRMSASVGEDDSQWVEAILRNLIRVCFSSGSTTRMAAVRNRSSDVQVIDLPPLLRESADLFLKGLSPSDRKIEIELECDAMTPRVRVDAGRLMQVFFNLLGNAQQAVSIANQGGRIVVRTGTCQDQGCRWVLVEVVDDGPGVPEEYIDRLFDPFFTTKEDGTGYGLYLAAEILKEQAGRLSRCVIIKKAAPRSRSGFPRTGNTRNLGQAPRIHPKGWGVCDNLDEGTIERRRVGPERRSFVAGQASISREPDQCPRRSVAAIAWFGRIAGCRRF